MRDLGYEERKTLETDFLSLGQVERFPAAMEELVRRKVDVSPAASDSFLTHRWRELDSNFRFRAR